MVVMLSGELVYEDCCIIIRILFVCYDLFYVLRSFFGGNEIHYETKFFQFQ